MNIMDLANTDQNFCRVFELPNEYPSDYCFGGGHPVTFRMVDWFNPIPMDGIGPEGITDWESLKNALLPFLWKKRYVKQGRKYLLIAEWGDAMVFSRTMPP